MSIAGGNCLNDHPPFLLEKCSLTCWNYRSDILNIWSNVIKHDNVVYKHGYKCVYLQTKTKRDGKGYIF